MTPTNWQPITFLRRVFPDSFEEFANTKSGLSIHKLNWDSDFFKAPILKIDYLPDNCSKEELMAAIPALGEKSMIFTEVPTQATQAIQVLCSAGFSMVETRLTYYHTLQNIPLQKNHSRFANLDDLAFLQNTASGAVNEFDRYHTDPFFSVKQASEYLETYISNCLNGFSETIFVPDLETPPASFVALSRVKNPELKTDQLLYRIPLTACLPENRGWHFHLCLSALHYAAEKGAFALVMTTQAANGAVIHNCEKLGFKLGSTFHIFSKVIL
jgi:dTDP-4-amino-4,6-dideoxy-D-galactose acyltransferase